MKVLIWGFTPMEHRLLNGVIAISQRRSPRIDVVTQDESQGADVVMLDALDPDAVAWARGQPWLRYKPVIWVDAARVPPGHSVQKRPVQWPSLAQVLLRAIDHYQAIHGAPPPEPSLPKPSLTATEAPTPPASAPLLSPVAKPSEPAAPPVATKPLVSALLAAAAAAPAPQRPEILVVDDSLAVRNYLRAMLEPRGMAVTEADNAEAGIAAASAQRFACILLDVLMPGIDGYEACRRIRATRRTTGGPAIIMLTSRSSPFDRIRGKMAGCDAYLTKPVDPVELREVLARYAKVAVAAPVAPVAPVAPGAAAQRSN